MTCPVCSNDTQVIYTYDNEDHIVRDRKCRRCNYRFQTIETDKDVFANRKVTCEACEPRKAKIEKAIQAMKVLTSNLEDIR